MRQGTESGGAGNRFTDIVDGAAGRQEVLDVNAGLMLSVCGYSLPPPCPVLGLWAQAGMDLRGFQPDRRVRKLRSFSARPRPGRAGSRCGPPVRPPAHAFQVMGLMINRFAVL
ncbi:hypothetical protein HMPREF9137_2355 [Prevotella denticola F0289]|nr:hypothetical protein HMPREF9137_2355 [Prevotella denticola F0289]